MVQRRIETVETNTQVQGPTTRVGKAHGGFIVALALAGPVMMLAVFAFVGLLMQGAQGATGLMWTVATLMFSGLGMGLVAAITAAESVEDPSRS
ncbi:MAG: hypothetical protein KTR31_09465 [Myxococcales bacterium]|nr:hypothetical protein [Myxococcales bacterium]